MDVEQINRWQNCAEEIVKLLCEWQNRQPDANTYSLVHNLLGQYKLQVRAETPWYATDTPPQPEEILDEEYEGCEFPDYINRAR